MSLAVSHRHQLYFYIFKTNDQLLGLCICLYHIYIFTHTHIYIYIALKAPNAILFYGRHSSPVSKQLLLGDKLQWPAEVPRSLLLSAQPAAGEGQVELGNIPAACARNQVMFLCAVLTENGNFGLQKITLGLLKRENEGCWGSCCNLAPFLPL